VSDLGKRTTTNQHRQNNESLYGNPEYCQQNI